MAGQVYSVSTLGGYCSVPILSKEVRDQAQPLLRFRQYTEIQEGYGGAKRGDTFNWDIIGNVAAAGGTLTETSTIPRTNIAIYQGTGSITEWGNAIPYTQKLVTLSQVNITDGLRRALRNDMAKVLDAAVEEQFDATNYRYVSLSASSGTMTTDGTATSTATGNINKYHVKQIVDYLERDLLAPPYDDESYASIVTVTAYNGIYTDVESVLMYTKYPMRGEFGMYYNCRFVKETGSMDPSVGLNSLTGEAYFFGSEPAAEAVAVPEEIRFQADHFDFGRAPGIAWYALLGFKIMHDANPNSRIVKFDSA